MKTLYDQSTRAELIARINSLNENSKAQWGKMNVYQMLEHGALWDEMVLRNKKYKRPFIGVLLGGIFLKKELKEGRIMRPNNPTIPDLVIKETTGDIETAKKQWIALIKEYDSYSLSDNRFVHSFFGKMTHEQVGRFAYKHTDHHLRQFKN